MPAHTLEPGTTVLIDMESLLGTNPSSVQILQDVYDQPTITDRSL
jgi:hypothetical protein